MRRAAIVMVCAASLAVVGAAGLRAQNAPPPPAVARQPVTPPAAAIDGQELYRAKCGMCHGPVGMGTGLLARRVQPAELEQRTNLTRAYVVAAARAGIGNMPAIPRGEASDAELNAIGDYLAARNPAAQ